MWEMTRKVSFCAKVQKLCDVQQDPQLSKKGDFPLDPSHHWSILDPPCNHPQETARRSPLKNVKIDELQLSTKSQGSIQIRIYKKVTRWQSQVEVLADLLHLVLHCKISAFHVGNVDCMIFPRIGALSREIMDARNS